MTAQVQVQVQVPQLKGRKEIRENEVAKALTELEIAKMEIELGIVGRSD